MPCKFSTIILFICIATSGCSEDVEFKFKTPKKINIDKKLTLSVVNTNGKDIDSVQFYLDGQKVGDFNGITLSLKEKVLGLHSLTARVFFENSSRKLNNTIYLLASKKPNIYTYKIVNTFPHDAEAFTQGLEFKNGFLYESTGQKGESSIRKTNLKTGEILQIKNLDKKYFGEGITILNAKLYQLTWQSKVGFVYDLETFAPIESFEYGESIEGWGLTNNGKDLIKSDGTERIWFLDPNTKKEKYFIEAYTNKRKAESLNEIEYIEGKIYANIWQKNTIIIVDSKNGTIEGVVNLNSLRDKVNKPDSKKTYVLNGIAYDPINKRIYVTGKNWDKTFEIKLIKK